MLSALFSSVFFSPERIITYQSLTTDNPASIAHEDTKAPFLRIPWTACLVDRANLVFRVPVSRKYKSSGEDSLFAEILITPRTIRSCIAFHQKPSPQDDRIDEVSVLMTIGDGVNGHTKTMHRGTIASVIDGTTSHNLHKIGQTCASCQPGGVGGPWRLIFHRLRLASYTASPKLGLSARQLHLLFKSEHAASSAGPAS